MPLRVLTEEILAYNKQLKIIKEKKKTINAGDFLYKYGKSDKLRPVATIVLYWGDKPWDGATSLHEMMDFSGAEEMRMISADYPLHIVDVSQIKDTSVFKSELRFLIDMFQLRNDKEGFGNYINNHLGEMEADSMLMLAEMTNSQEIKNFITDKHYEVNTKEGKREVCKAFTELLNDKVNEGREEGREEMGKLITALLTAGRMDDLARMAYDEALRQSLCKEFGIA